LVFARVASWRFKPDQRKRGFDMLESSVGELVRRIGGFRESLILLSHDDPNVGIIITLWNSEEAEKVYADNVFKLTTRNLEPFVTGPPEVTHYTVYSSEIKQ
jgi:heme-degrading monooxygenase HmoA